MSRPQNQRRRLDRIRHKPAPLLHMSELANDIIHSVAQLYDINIHELFGASRRMNTAEARHVVAWLLVRKAGRTQEDTARLLCRWNHTTIGNSVKRVDATRPSEPVLNRRLEQLCASLFPPMEVAA